MIILHGSGGTWGGRGARDPEFLSQNGIGALIIDTFSGRGPGEKDKQMIEASEYCVDFGYSIGRSDKTNELANAELLKTINQHMRSINK